MRTLWQRFFWGPPSHKRVAWIGMAAGLAVIALPLVVVVFGSGGHPLWLLALFVVGLAEAGWGVEPLPQRCGALAGKGRAARWLCAVVGLVLSGAALLAQLAPLWWTGVVTACALLLVLEMAPAGFANRA